MVTRGIIFRRAIQLYPCHCGGRKNNRLFSSLKNWFYGGFKKRMKLSKRRVSSTGQKLPKDWRAKQSLAIRRVAGAQTPVPRPEGSFASGVSDDKMGNTDQVPVYIEDHGNGQWGLREDHDRRCISTTGKD